MSKSLSVKKPLPKVVIRGLMYVVCPFHSLTKTSCLDVESPSGDDRLSRVL